MKTAPLLFYACEADPDFLRATRFAAPDPTACLCLADKTILVASELELERAKTQTSCEVLCLSDMKEQTRLGIIKQLLEENNVKDTLFVTSRFPCNLYQALKDMYPHMTINFVTDGLECRRQKMSEEIENIQLANSGSRNAFDRVRQILEDATVENGTNILIFNGQQLTSEILKREIEIACIQKDSVSLSTIAAGGSQSAQPHCSGYGPLHANELIICDIFPRHRSGYFGDMTRTFLKGTPTDKQKQMVSAVKMAHDECEKMVKVGVEYKDIADRAFQILEQQGFPKEVRNGVPVGMIHGLGHGVGLEIHEEPKVNTRSKQTVQIGDVFTIEPGVYYPELGGVRIEDSYWIASDGTLHKFQEGTSYEWIVQ